MKNQITVMGKQFFPEELGIIGFSLLGIIATLLPFITIEAGILSQTYKLISNSNGILVIILFVVTISLAVLTRKNTIVSSISGLLIFIMIAIVWFSLEDIQRSMAKFNFGFYVLVIVGIGLLTCAGLSYSRQTKGSDGLDETFSNITKKTKEVTNSVKTKVSETIANGTINNGSTEEQLEAQIEAKKAKLEAIKKAKIEQAKLEKANELVAKVKMQQDEINKAKADDRIIELEKLAKDQEEELARLRNK